MLVDCHTHLNNYHQQPGGPPELLRQLRANLDQHKIDHCMVLSSYKVNPDRPSTDQLLELVAPDPRLHVVEGIGVSASGGVDWTRVEERLRDRKTWGLKFYPGYEHFYPTDPVYRRGIELAGTHRVPIMIHSGDTFSPKGKLKFAHPLHVDELAVDFPDVNFVICHLGNPWFTDTAEIIYKNDNVLADISGLVLGDFTSPLEAYMRDGLKEVLLFAGEPDSILYGTDWPLVNMAPYLAFVRQLGLDPDTLRLLMGDNAARIFRLPDAPPRGPASPRRAQRTPKA